MHDAEHDAMQAAQHGETWATLAEAASFLGCSVDTVRRRIRRGGLHAMQDAGGHGPTWRVLLSATPSVLPTVGSTPSSTPSVNGSVPSTTPSIGDDTLALLEALRLLDALRQENRDVAGQVGYLQAGVQLQEDTLRARQAPQQPVDAPTAPESQDPTTALVPRRRRWGAWVPVGLVVAEVGSASCQPPATVRHGGLNWRQLDVDAGCCEGRASWMGRTLSSWSAHQSEEEESWSRSHLRMC